ncbi:MAG: signal peptidase I [Candidatus Woesearchaeota archaeon]
MRIIIVSLALGFLLGILLASQLINSTDNLEIPYTISSPDLMSPSDTIKEHQIRVYNDKVIIDIEAEWAKIANTKSMDPVLDEGTFVLQIIPQNENEIHLGDIVTYINSEGMRIIHRVIGIEKDEIGTYFILKGDNNKNPDPYKVRFDMIDRKLVGILY